ncbi:MAG: glycosyltransferase, partial [Acidimicrobiales bacterium]
GRLGVAKRVRFLGRIADADLADLYAAADVFAMLCRNRWRGLEQEGFGIVFLEAAACGVASIAGASGGAADAVEDGVTGLVVDPPTDVRAVATALARLLDDEPLRVTKGAAGRRRVEERFEWDDLAAQLHAALTRWTP